MGNWEYEAFSGFGQGLATGLTERRKRQDKEEGERQKRLIALLQGKAASGVKDLDGYDDLKDMAQADPSQLPTLINTAQERRKSGAAQADQDDARSQFLRTMGVGTEYGPTSPDVETKADVYSKSAQASRPTIIDKAMQEKSQPFVGDVAKTFGLDPMKLQMRTQGGMTTSQAVDAELADRQKGEKDGNQRVYDIQVEQRKEIAKSRNLKEGSPEWRTYVYATEPDKPEYPQDNTFIQIKLAELNRLRREQDDARDNAPAGQPFIPKSEQELDVLATQSTFQIIAKGQQDLMMHRREREKLEEEARRMGIQ